MKRVLIVDDALFMRGALRKILEEGGFEVVGEAVNGTEAVKKYMQLKPDFVTMDITMPEMDGVQAVKIIKDIDKEARIIIVSAMGQEDAVKASVVAGAKGFVVKPFKPEYVIGALRRLAAQ